MADEPDRIEVKASRGVRSPPVPFSITVEKSAVDTTMIRRTVTVIGIASILPIVFRRDLHIVAVTSCI